MNGKGWAESRPMVSAPGRSPSEILIRPFFLFFIEPFEVDQLDALVRE